MVDAQGNPYQNQSSGISSIQSDLTTFHLNYMLVQTMLPEHSAERASYYINKICQAGPPILETI